MHLRRGATALGQGGDAGRRGCPVSDDSDLLIRAEIVNRRPLLGNLSVLHAQQVEDHDVEAFASCCMIAERSGMHTTKLQADQHLVAFGDRIPDIQFEFGECARLADLKTFTSRAATGGWGMSL